MGAMTIAACKLNNSEDKVVGLIERVKDLVLGHRDGLRAGNATLDLDKEQCEKGLLGGLGKMNLLTNVGNTVGNEFSDNKKGLQGKNPEGLAISSW